MATIPPLKTRTVVRGFTIVEMLVVLAIIVFVTMVAITGQSSFNRSLILTDTAYTIAFSLREAQTLGLSSRVSNNLYDAGYGVMFSNQTPKSYVLFADTRPVAPGLSLGGDCPGHTQLVGSPDSRPGNCEYDVPATELVRTYTLNSNYRIAKFCGVSGSTTHCSDGTLETIHITFMRPSTNAVILGFSADGASRYELSRATIYLSSPDGAAERCIQVSSVGQIAVASCP